MINDYIEVESGEVIDLGVDIDVITDKNNNDTEIIRTIITNVTNFFSISKRKMGDPLFIGDLYREIGTIPGVVNVVDIKVFNKIGGDYSTSEVVQDYSDIGTKQILDQDNVIFMKTNQIYQIKYPNKDIRIRTKSLTSTTF